MLPFVARNEWLEKCNQELLDEKADSDQKRIAAEVKLAAITLEMKEKHEDLQDGQDQHAIRVSVKERVIQETSKEIEDKTATLKKREEELGTRTLKTRRNFPVVGPNADVYDAI